MRILLRRDFVGGVFLVIVGVAFAIVARHYPFGTMARFGSGFFPFWLGITLAGLGVLLAVSSLFSNGINESGLTFPDLRAFVTVIGGVLLFGAVLTKLGLLLSVVILVLVSSLGSREFRWFSTLGLALFLAVFCYAVFVYGLGLIVPVLPATFN